MKYFWFCLGLILVFEGNAIADKLNVQKYGAIGDGITNDTTAIQTTLDSLPPSGGTIFLPPGNYKISRPIIIKTSHTSFIGSGKKASTIIFDSISQSLVIQAEKGFPISNILIKGIRFVNHGKPVFVNGKGHGRAAIQIDNYLEKVSNVSILENFIDGGPTVGIGLSGDGILVSNNKIINTTQHGIYISVGREVRLIGNEISGIAFNSPITVQSGIKVSNSIKVLIEKNNISHLNHHVAAINVGNSSNNVSIKENKIYLSNSNQYGIRIHSGRVKTKKNIIDGGEGFQNTLAIDVKGGKGAYLEETQITGSWVSSPISVRNDVSEVVFDNFKIFKGPTSGWAVNLRNSIRPTIKNSSILSGGLGINLGKTDGARILNNQILVTDRKYGIGGHPTNCIILEGGKSLCQ